MPRRLFLPGAWALEPGLSDTYFTGIPKNQGVARMLPQRQHPPALEMCHVGNRESV